MQAYRAYYEKGNFVPVGKYDIPEGAEAIVTVLDKKPKKSIKKRNKAPTADKTFWAGLDRLREETRNEEQELRISWLERLDESINASLDEELLYIPRSTLMREPINLSDEV